MHTYMYVLANARADGSSINGPATTPSKPQQQVVAISPASRILHPRNHTASAAPAPKKPTDFTVYEMNKQFRNNTEHHHYHYQKHSRKEEEEEDEEVEEEVEEEEEEKENNRDGKAVVERERGEFVVVINNNSVTYTCASHDTVVQAVGSPLKRLALVDDAPSLHAADNKASEPNDFPAGQKSQREEDETMSEIMGKHKSLRGLLLKRLSNLQVSERRTTSMRPVIVQAFLYVFSSLLLGICITDAARAVATRRSYWCRVAPLHLPR